MKTIRRRRLENKTDYKVRMKFLKSGAPRIIFRRTNRYIIAEYAVSEEAKDRIVLGITSKALLKKGWPEKMKGSLKSLSASYLTGLLFGREIAKKKLETPILDIGMMRSMPKGRIFSFVRGLADSGIKMKCNPEFFPSEDRIKGKNMKNDFSSVFSKIKNEIEDK